MCDFLLLLPFVFAIDFVPFQRVFRGVVFLSPIGNISSYESTPEFGIFPFNLRGIRLDLVELLSGIDAEEDGTNRPILKVTNIIQT